jgi:hypothetical protein
LPAILERTGQPPKVLIPFQCDGPFKKIATKFETPDGTLHKVEVLCDGQQFIADGIHPDTGEPYRWKDDNDLLSVSQPLEIKLQTSCRTCSTISAS